MNKSLEKLIEEFYENEIDPLLSVHTPIANEIEPTYLAWKKRTEEKIIFLALKAHAAGKEEMSEEVRKIVPDKQLHQDISEYYSGFNACHNKILSKLDELRKE